MGGPTVEHQRSMYRVMRFVVQTKQLMLKYKDNGDGKEDELIGYCHASYAGYQDTRKSVTGYAIFFCGNLIAWKYKMQSCITLSSTEAECI